MRIYSVTSLAALMTAAAPGFAQDPSVQQSSIWSGWSTYADVQLQARYDAVAISEFSGDWRRDFTPRSDRNLLFQRNHANAGVEKDGWFLGYDIRQDASLVADGQTLDLIRRIKQQDRPDGAVVYDLNARMTSWRAQGAQFGRRFAERLDRPGFSFSVGIYGKPVYRDNQVSGSLSATPPDQFAADLVQRDINTRASIPFQNGSASGSGATFSAGLRLPVTQELTASLVVEDLFSCIRLTNVPVTVQQVNTAAAHYDSQRFVTFTPLLTGSNTQQSQNVSLPRYSTADLVYTDGAWSARGAVVRFAGVTMPEVSAARQFAFGEVSARYEFRYKMVGLGYRYKGLNIAMASDSLSARSAKAAQVAANYRWQF